MKIEIKPPTVKDNKGKEKRFNPYVPYPNTALEFRYNEITIKAFARNFKLELPEKINEYVEVIVTDGRNNKNIVQIFNKNRTVCCCSCEDFINDECRYCVHIAAIENVLRYSVHYKKQDENYSIWRKTLNSYLNSIPTSIKQFKQHYTFWDPYKNIFYGFGKNKPTEETVGTKTFKKIQKRKKRDLVKYLPEPNDEGLLQGGVNLFDYQKEVFSGMVKAQRAICSMVMGSGKTITTIACYAFIDKHKPDKKTTMLIVVPKSLRTQWGTEIERICAGKKVFQLEKPKQIDKALTENIVTVTYQFLTKHIEKLSKRKWDVVVIDEIQFVRNNKTKTWKALAKIKSDFLFGLSGTVIENSLEDLYSIMEIINPGALGPKWKFCDNYQNIYLRGKTKWIYRGCRNLNKLKELLKDKVFSYDKLKLPPIKHNNVFIDISANQRSLHDDFYFRAKELIAKSINGTGLPHEKLLVQSLLLKSRQVGNTQELITKNRSAPPSTKIQKFLEIVENVCVVQNKKIVIFSDWTEMLDICNRFVGQKFNFKTVFFTGRENLKQRMSSVNSFQNDMNCKLIFVSDAGGIGLDGLQLAASNVIHLELPWNPAKLDQRTGRVYRTLQKNDVNIYYLISRNTIEENIFSLIKEKKQIRVQTLTEFNVS